MSAHGWFAFQIQTRDTLHQSWSWLGDGDARGTRLEVAGTAEEFAASALRGYFEHLVEAVPEMAEYWLHEDEYDTDFQVLVWDVWALPGPAYGAPDTDHLSGYQLALLLALEYGRGTDWAATTAVVTWPHRQVRDCLQELQAQAKARSQGTNGKQEDEPGPRDLDELDDLFVRCGSCGLVAEPTSADVVLLPGGGYDFTSGGSTARCAPCGGVQPLTPETVALDRSGVHTCRTSNCAATRPCPPDAARVQCRECGVFCSGPGAVGDQAVADQLHAAETLHALELRSTWERTKRRAAGLPELDDQ